MSVIEMSPAFAAGYTTRMIGFPNAIVNIGTPAQAPLFNVMTGAEASGRTIFGIMKGTVPADFTTLVNTSSRSSDTLVRFGTSNYGGPNPTTSDFGPSTFSGNTATMDTTYIGAIATGVATWFWCYQLASYNTSTIFQQFFGTVGTVGSGADLEIPSTNIVSGDPYRLINFQLRFPTTWTY